MRISSVFVKLRLKIVTNKLFPQDKLSLAAFSSWTIFPKMWAIFFLFFIIVLPPPEKCFEKVEREAYCCLWRNLKLHSHPPQKAFREKTKFAKWKWFLMVTNRASGGVNSWEDFSIFNFYSVFIPSAERSESYSRRNDEVKRKKENNINAEV